MDRVQRLANRFTEAFYARQWDGPLEPDVASLALAEAYDVQDRVMRNRLARGEVLAGYKVGCTSRAIQTQFGLDEPIYGRLFHPHIFSDGVTVDWRAFAGCAIEPELIVKMGSEIRGMDLPDARLLDAIDSIGVGIELHHYCFWFDPPSLQELICSNGIHAGLIGEASCRDLHRLSFCDEEFRVLIDNRLVAAAPASEIMGGPLHSLRWLVNSLTRRGSCLPKQSLVIPGSPTPLIRIDRDCEVLVEIDHVGSANVRFRSPPIA